MITYGPIINTSTNIMDGGDDVECDAIEGEGSFRAKHIAIEVYILNTTLIVLKNKYGIKEKDLNDFMSLIDDYGQRKYNEGSCSDFD